MKAGVYQIRNMNNGKSYIGSAVDLKDRWRCHQKDANTQQHHSIKFQRAWNKHNADAFVFVVLLYCDPQDCLMYEQIALDHFKPEYNICKIAGSSFGVKRSRDFIERMRTRLVGQKQSEETKAKRRMSLCGQKRSEAMKEKMSKLQTGENNTRAKLTNANVDEIRHLLSLGVKGIDLARRFNVATSTISQIKTYARRS